MKNKLTVLLLTVALILLLGGAFVLYDCLSKDMANNQLAIQQQPTQSVSTTEQHESTAYTEDTIPIAPDFTVYDKDGNAVQLSDYFGKPIVLNFWASWCGPCKMEMPDFNEKYLEMGEEIHFLMINMTDGSRETVRIASEFIATQGYEFPVFYDTESDAAITYRAYSLPTTYFIDAQGHAIAQAVGAIDAETLQKGIDMITS